MKQPPIVDWVGSVTLAAARLAGSLGSRRLTLTPIAGLLAGIRSLRGPRGIRLEVGVRGSNRHPQLRSPTLENQRVTRER
jgi:hypothetical protein